MKVLALLFLAVSGSVAVSKWEFQPGKEHVFGYSGRLLTGFPHLANHYSGLGINATVKVQVIGQEKLQLYVENAKYTKINQPLEQPSTMDGVDGENWRELILPSMQQVSGEYQQYLEQPFVFSLVNGEIRSPKVSSMEPEWSVNFKKALALLFQAKVESLSMKLQQNEIRDSYSQGLNYWKVKEETIDGLCENTYQINELPKYMILDKPELIPRIELCPEQKFYEVIKIRNADTCEKQSIFSFYKPGSYRCSGPNCKEMWSRTIETRYIACGRPEQLVIQTVINNWELRTTMAGYKTEPLVSGNLQVLKLKEIRSASPKPQPSNMVPLQSMMYEYSRKAYSEQVSQQQEPRIPRNLARQPEQVAKALPRNFLQAISKPVEQEIPKQKIIQQVVETLRQITHLLENPIEQNAAQKSIVAKTMIATSALSYLGQHELEQVYQQVQNQGQHQIAKNIFYDTVLMTGTPESIIFLKNKMVSGQVSKPQMLNILFWLPQNIVVPTQKVLEELYELVQSQEIRQHPTIKRIADLSYTNLLQKVCTDLNREVSYPVHVFGKFCSPRSPILTEKWIPYLKNQLQSAESMEKKNEIIIAMGMLPSREVVHQLIPVIEGQYPQQQVPTMTRVLALWSIATAGAHEPQTIVPLVYSLYANPAEPTEIRITAFKVLIKLNPPMSYFQKIAAQTWQEQDIELLKFVNSGLYTLMVQSEVTMTEQRYDSPQSKAQLTYPLIKKVKSLLPTSAAVYTSDYMPYLGVAYEGSTSWIGSNTSFIPLEIYTDLKYYFEQYQVKPISMGLRMEGVETLYDRIVELVTPLQQGQNPQELRQRMSRQIKEQLSEEWKKVIQQLGIHPRETEHISGSFYLNLMETTPLFMSINKMTVEQLKEKIYRSEEELMRLINSEHEINYARIVDLARTEALIPTDMGFPLNMDYHLQMAVSGKGKIGLQVQSATPRMNLKKTLFATSQATGFIGTVVPFTKEFVATSIDLSKSVSLPISLEASLNLPSQHLKITVQLDQSISRPIRLVEFNNQPYTVYGRVDEFSQQSESRQTIRSQEQQKHEEREFGSYYGLHLTVEQRTESSYTDLRSMVDKARWYNFCVMNMARFSQGVAAINQEGKPTLRSHKLSLVYDPTRSSTKQVQFDIKLGYAVKSQSSEQFLYKRMHGDQISQLSIQQEHLSQSGMHPQRKAKLAEGINRLTPVDTGKALTMTCTISLQGSSRPVVSTYSLFAAVGHHQQPSEQLIKAKWNVELRSQTTGSKIQAIGKVDMPVVPLWNIEEIQSRNIQFNFENELKIRQEQGTEFMIKVHGNSRRSQSQKQFSQQHSLQAKQCQKEIEQQQQQQQQQQQRLSGLGKLSPACQLVRQQALTLDEVEFTINYVNVPQPLMKYESLLVQQIKAVLWPFIRKNQQTQGPAAYPQTNGQTKVKLFFNKQTPSFDMVIVKPNEEIVFKQLRIPYPLGQLIPLKAGVNNLKLAAQKLTGKESYPECTVTKNTINTFDNKTMPFHIDYCYHMIAADCSGRHQFGIMSRLMQSGNMRQMKVFLGKHVIVFTPEQQPQQGYANIAVSIDGQNVFAPKNAWAGVKTSSGVEIAKVFHSTNDAFVLDATQYGIELRFDGYNFIIESVSPSMKGKLCGMCGNMNNQPRDDVEGPKKCIYSKPSVEAASYRLSNKPQGCDQQQPLPQYVQQQLRQEQEQCVRQQIIPTKVHKSFKLEGERCETRQHVIVQESGSVCFTKEQYVVCGGQCQSQNKQRTSAAFTCMNQQEAQQFVNQVEQGQFVPQLAQRHTSYKMYLMVPNQCRPIYV